MLREYNGIVIRDAKIEDAARLCRWWNDGKVRTNIDSWKDQLGRLQSSVDYELTKERFISYLK